MTPDPLEKLLDDYFRGDLSLEEAAAALHERNTTTDFFLQADDHDPAKRELAEALIARVLWLTLRAADPEAVPAEPFGPADLRTMLDEQDDSSDPGKARG
jgi:hypothetical protein